MIQPEADIVKQNNFYPNMLAMAERAWERGVELNISTSKERFYRSEDSESFKSFADLREPPALA